MDCSGRKRGGRGREGKSQREQGKTEKGRKERIARTHHPRPDHPFPLLVAPALFPFPTLSPAAHRTRALVGERRRSPETSSDAFLADGAQAEEGSFDAAGGVGRGERAEEGFGEA